MRKKSTSKREGQANLFASMAGCIGIGGIMTSLWFHSIWPIAIACIGLSCILSFMNGLL